jgi:hypothetical protein
MGLFNVLFPKDSSVAEDIVTGAAIGAVIGDKLDERQDRARILRLLHAMLLQGEYHFAIEQSERQMKALDKLYKIEKAANDAWRWPWDRGDLEALKLYTKWMQRKKDQAFADTHSQLAPEWHDLCNRARDLGLSAAAYMPRSIYGDVMGTPEMLRHGFDRVREKIEILEAEQVIKSKFGVE